MRKHISPFAIAIFLRFCTAVILRLIFIYWVIKSFEHMWKMLWCIINYGRTFFVYILRVKKNVKFLIKFESGNELSKEFYWFKFIFLWMDNFICRFWINNDHKRFFKCNIVKKNDPTIKHLQRSRNRFYITGKKKLRLLFSYSVSNFSFQQRNCFFRSEKIFVSKLPRNNFS